ncbi:hypothetical protein ACE38W_14965 [Chitinophaga sp. Hz27]|uniref:hypothetical protein n=1 Tax=Chitinophaga sp. Hz27 TaxID=3347169 RepID=UPI0035D980C7
MSLVINDTSYAGDFASYFWIPATYNMSTVEKGAVYVKDGIKKKHTIGRVDFSRPLQPRQATPISKGVFTIDGRDLEPKDVMLYNEFNPRDFEAHWLAERQSPTLLARELPVTAEHYMLQMALNRSMEQLENGLWIGSVDYADNVDEEDPRFQVQYFDGFIKKMILDAAVRKVANPGPLTAAPTGSGNVNIADAFNAQLSLAAQYKKALLAKNTRYQRLKFFVSINTEQIYHDFLTTSQTFKGVNTTERGINLYKGYEVVPLAGMPDNTVVLAEGLPDTDSNLYVGMNSTEDNQLQLMRLQNNSELFFIKGLMKYDVEYGFSEEVFLYTTLTISDFQP